MMTDSKIKKPSWGDKLLKKLKGIPVDFGQESVAEKTKGKLIAMSLVPKVRAGDRKRALDVGCRKGVQSRWLKSKGYEVVSVDIQKEYEQCIVSDVNAGVPFQDEAFDLVWCSEVIEHLTDPGATITEFLRVARQGGEVILTTPNSHFWLYKLFALFGITAQKMQREDHLHFFHLKDIESFCPEARIYGFFPYLLLKLRISNRPMISLLSPTFVVHIRKGPLRRPVEG